jgi:hypothetical protein
MDGKTTKKAKAATGGLKKKEKVLEFGRGSTRLRSPENSFWKRLWTCCKAYYIMNGLILEYNHYSYHSYFS